MVPANVMVEKEFLNTKSQFFEEIWLRQSRIAQRKVVEWDRDRDRERDLQRVIMSTCISIFMYNYTITLYVIII